MNEKEYQSRIAELEALLEEKCARIAYLEEQFRVAQHKQFGKSTEGHSGQGELLLSEGSPSKGFMLTILVATLSFNTLNHVSKRKRI